MKPSIPSTETSPTGERTALAAHVLPFALFLGALFMVQVLDGIFADSQNLLLKQSKYWIFPLQTLACGAALLFFWRRYTFGPVRSWLLAVAVGLGVFALWISPQWLFGAAPRTDGFDPTLFADDPFLYGWTIAARLLRLVIVVPLVEEIFWRGFLQRYLVSERFMTVSFGTFTPLSFFGVAVAFTLVHSQPDWPAAFVTGIVYGWLAVRTKSLFVCVLAHAVTNLALGVYILSTRQWGFW